MRTIDFSDFRQLYREITMAHRENGNRPEHGPEHDEEWKQWLFDEFGIAVTFKRVNKIRTIYIEEEDYLLLCLRWPK